MKTLQAPLGDRQRSGRRRRGGAGVVPNGLRGRGAAGRGVR
eukprot:gene19389-biopygen2499